MDYKFYNTSSLLLKADNLFSDSEEGIVISSISINELENIKTSNNKNSEVKYAARHLLKELENNKYTLILYENYMINELDRYDFEITNDLKILASALYFKSKKNPKDKVYFITNDLIQKNIAKSFFQEDYLQSIHEENVDNYCGYIDISLSPEEMSYLYQYPEINTFNLLTNEYIIVRDKESNQIVDTLCWTGSNYRKLKYKELNSSLFGKIKPMKNDIQQAIAIDSLQNNQITMLKGKPGSGKSTLSIGYLFDQLDKGKIDKIIIFCNPVATMNSARLGFYPGTKDEKLLDSQIGNFLISKLGGRIAVEELISREKLILLPMSDIRGFDTTGLKAGVYITEAQNLDKTLMKLALQRIGEDSICIIDGDCKTQVDDINFAGVNNGMKRTSKVVRGKDVYGEVKLNTIHRCKIAEIAEEI